MSTTLEKGQTINFYKATMPIILSVFAIYLTIGIALGALPKFVQNNLGFNSLIIGLVIGLQSLATLVTRAYSGKITDTKGAKKSKMSGVILSIIAGVTYIIAVSCQSSPLLALGFLLLARIIHGVGESFLVTGALTWGIGLAGHQSSGKVMTWNGIAMYAGIAIGAPLSIWLSKAGFLQQNFRQFRFGGFRVAFVSLIIEAAGQMMIWTSGSKEMAIIGCGLTGIGFSLIFPALGVLAIQKVKPQMRGTALGAYVAFVDLSLGLAGPAAGLAAGWFNYQTVYLFGVICCILSMIIL
ncbi:unnamed protein product, partial [Oppiella nova]